MSDLFNDLDNLTAKLEQISINRYGSGGVSFCERSLKLDTAEDAKEVIDAINAAESVVSLNLAGNSLGVNAADAISKALESRHEFREAQWKDMFTGRLKIEIPAALKSLSRGLMAASAKLRVLDLSDNASGPVGVEGFEDLLRSPVCYSLEELRLNNMGLGISGAQKLAKALMDLIENSKNNGTPLQLKVFEAGRNRLENSGVIALSRVLRMLGTLEELILPQNSIYPRGIKALTSVMWANPGLRKIDLNDNTLTSHGSRYLSCVLPSLKSLKELDLGDCLARTQGAKCLAGSLKQLSELQMIDLTCGEITAAGAVDIANAIPPNCCLRLSGNSLGQDCIEQLTLLAKSHPFELVPIEDDDYDSEEQLEEEDSDSVPSLNSSNSIQDNLSSSEENNDSCHSEAGSDRKSGDSASLTSEETSSEYTTTSSSINSNTSTSDNDTSISSGSSHYCDCKNSEDIISNDSPQPKIKLDDSHQMEETNNKM